MESIEQLDSSVLNSLLEKQTTNLIPESLVTAITTGILVLTVLGALFLVIYLFSVIRKWRVDSAILQMQKDVAEIKGQLVASRPEPVTTKPIQDERTKQ